VAWPYRSVGLTFTNQKGYTMSLSLSSGVRQALSSIQSTAAMAQATQLRLATGKKVNSAIDNPSSFFTASGLNNRAGDLSRRLDGIGQGVKTLEAADNGIKGITKLVESAKSIVTQARQSSDNAVRESLRQQYDEIQGQIDELTNDSGYNGVNLIKNGADDLTVVYNEDGSSKSEITGKDLDSAGLGLTGTAANAWDDAAGVTAMDGELDKLDAALTTLRTQAATFGASLSTVKNREEFTQAMVNTLRSGADSLVLADSNEEGANLLALQTRGQLAQTALSLASQADQAVLRMF